jgi:N-acetyl-D-muramate 6-phosphate phosphatase
MSLCLSNLQAVLFDLDGTLLDSAPDLGFAANRLRIERGLAELPMSEYRPFVGTGARGMLRIALGVAPEDPSFEVLKEEFFVAYETCMGTHSRLFDGVSQLIALLDRSALHWGVVTNKSKRFTLPIVAQIQQFATAKVVICGDTMPHAKPHPEPLLEAARRLKVDADRCIYVGDDERDMVAAHAAGMQSVAAAYGYLGNVSSVASWRPHAVINSPFDLARGLGLN